MKKVFNSITQTAITTWKTKSFSFAFVVVFLFGSILVGFLGQIYLSILRHFDISQEIKNIKGYLSLAYLIFSIIYIYKKSKTLSYGYNKTVLFLLFLYSLSCIFSFFISGYYSLLFLIGSLLYSSTTGADVSGVVSAMISFSSELLHSAITKLF